MFLVCLKPIWKNIYNYFSFVFFVLGGMNINFVDEIFLRSLVSRRSLFTRNEKTAFAGRFFEGSRVCGSLNQGNWLLEGAVTKFVLSV